MQEPPEDVKKRPQELEGGQFTKGKNVKSKKFKEKISIGNNLAKEEDVLVKKKEEEEKARKRTRGPYRKSSRAGLL